jgi:hypothetical protein
MMRMVLAGKLSAGVSAMAAMAAVAQAEQAKATSADFNVSSSLRRSMMKASMSPDTHADTMSACSQAMSRTNQLMEGCIQYEQIFSYLDMRARLARSTWRQRPCGSGN